MCDRKHVTERGSESCVYVCVRCDRGREFCVNVESYERERDVCVCVHWSEHLQLKQVALGSMRYVDINTDMS